MSKINTVNLKSLLLFFILLFISHSTDAIADDQLSNVLDGILKRYGELRGIFVPYKREIITKSMALLGEEVKSDTAEGKILFRPPHYLAIQQEKPEEEIVTTDGQTIWYYIASKNTVYEYPANKLGKEVELLSDIFSGLRNVDDSFEVTQTESEDQKEYHIKLVPNPSWEEVAYIGLVVEKTNFDIRIIEIYDLFGSITMLTLGELSVRNDLKKEDFRFKAPTGVKTVKEE